MFLRESGDMFLMPFLSQHPIVVIQSKGWRWMLGSWSDLSCIFLWRFFSPSAPLWASVLCSSWSLLFLHVFVTVIPPFKYFFSFNIERRLFHLSPRSLIWFSTMCKQYSSSYKLYVKSYVFALPSFSFW